MTMPSEPTASHATLSRYFQSGVWLFIISVVLLGSGATIKHWHASQTEIQQTYIERIHERLLKELEILNQDGVPEPVALQSSLQLNQEINARNPIWLLPGHLYTQKLLYLLKQLVETLSRPISGLDSEIENRIQRESALRLEAVPRLEEIQQHIQSGSTGLGNLLIILGIIPTLFSLFFLGKWFHHNQTDSYKRRINTLSRAIQSQEQNELKRLGATNALDGLMNILEKTRNVEQRQALLQIGKQLDVLKKSGHEVLGFANSFHKLSSHATELARNTLTHEQKIHQADNAVEVVQNQLNGLRDDMRGAAQGLRKAGQASRQLLDNLQNAKQMQLDLADHDINSTLQNLVVQNQKALKEAIEGMVLATQKVNTSNQETNKLSEHLAVNQAAWSNLIEEVERHAELASNDSSSALKLARNLIENSKQNLAMIEQSKKSNSPISGTLT